MTKDELIEDLAAQSDLLQVKKELVDVIIERLKASEAEESEDLLMMRAPTGDCDALVHCGLHFLNVAGCRIN